MPFRNINKIKSLIDQGSGLARPSHYYVFLGLPNFMGNQINQALNGNLNDIQGLIDTISFGKETIQGISLKAQTVNLPGKQLTTTPFIMYGTEQKLPYGVAFDDLNIQFMCTNSMNERKFFDIWHRFITDPMSNNWHYYDDYVSNILIAKVPPAINTDDINAFDFLSGIFKSIASGGLGGLTSGLPTYIMQIEEAYPVTIQSQELSYASEDYLTLNVQFSYRRWKSNEDIGNNVALF